jgi:hypothetical protein
MERNDLGNPYRVLATIVEKNGELPGWARLWPAVPRRSLRQRALPLNRVIRCSGVPAWHEGPKMSSQRNWRDVRAFMANSPASPPGAVGMFSSHRSSTSRQFVHGVQGSSANPQLIQIRTAST